MNKTEKKNSLSLGFIGGSLRSAVGYAHYVSCGMDDQWTLKAGCFSQDSIRNQKTAKLYGVSPDRVYDNWQEMIKKEKGKLDAVLVLTPTPTHCDIVSSCLNQGIPVICEKALASNSTEITKIMQARNKNNGFLAVTYNYSGYPMVRELKNLIKTGVLGDILHFQAEMPQEGFIRVDRKGNKPEPQSWRLSDQQVPTIYLDLAVHLHQLIYYLIEEKPIEVISTQDSYGWFSNVIDNVSSLCRYSGGIQGQIWFSKTALGNRNGLKLRIFGSGASVEWFQGSPEEFILSYSDGRREILDRASDVKITNLKRYNRFKAGHPAGFIEAFANLYSDIALALRQYQSTGKWSAEDVFSAELAGEGLNLLEAMVESTRSKKWQKVKKQL